MAASSIPYKRVLLKLSGEILLEDQRFGIQHNACLNIARTIQSIQAIGMQVAIVIGAGNIFRGLDLRATGMPRTPADHMGMLATLLNGLALQQALMSIGSKTCVMSALECPRVAEPYNWSKAIQHLNHGDVVIFVGGTGNPYFTTDTAAALRASEMQVEILLKATKVNGIYDKDPLKHPDAIKYDEISYAQFLRQRLQVMDATAVTLCQSQQIPIFVFNMQQLGQKDIRDILSDPQHGTFIR